MRETQIIVMLEDITRSRDKGMNVDILILDFSKAFNSVHHELPCAFVKEAEFIWNKG